MQRRFLLVLFSLFALGSIAQADDSHVTATGLLREMNLARQNPALYATYIEGMRSHFDGKQLVLPGGTRIHTKEGVRALDDAVQFLRHAQAQSPLTLSPGMCRASADHCADQVAGRRGHDGSDRSNPAARISRYGEWGGGWGENLAYGKTNACDIVMALIIDDGLSARKHRKNIFNPRFNVVGAAFGPHAIYRTVCSMDFAGSYTEHSGTGGALVARNF